MPRRRIATRRSAQSGGNLALAFTVPTGSPSWQKTPSGGSNSTCVRMPGSIGQYGHVVLAVDTEGNLIGLHSMG
jgi:predicted enzyme related to lactoylglutathione lyase